MPNSFLIGLLPRSVLLTVGTLTHLQALVLYSDICQVSVEEIKSQVQSPNDLNSTSSGMYLCCLSNMIAPDFSIP